MTLQEVFNLLNERLAASSKKAEKRVYEEFIQIIAGLQQRDLSEEEIKSIETTLGNLEFNQIHMKNWRHARKMLKEFKRYLKDTLSLTTSGHYTNLGVILGTAIGVLLGVVLLSGMERSLGTAYGAILGMLIGLLIGRHWDVQAKASGKMI